MKEQAKLIHREIGWLSFNERVLQEAQDLSVPLIERIRFLGIFSNNLDEFFKVRVATIKRMIDVQEGSKRVEGEKPKKIMNNIQKKVIYLKDKSIYLAVKLLRNEDPGNPGYAIIEVPTDDLPRFIEMPSDHQRKFIILLEDVIRYSLDDVFAIFHYDTFDSWIIKLTRDAELDMDNDLSKSFLELISKGVSGRKTGQPVRFVFDNSIAKDLLEYILTRLGIDEDDNIIPGGRYHNFKDFMQFPNVAGSEFEYKRELPLGHQLIKYHKSIIEAIKKKDIMLHVPYHDFQILIKLLQEAAIDPQVTEMSLTVYRVARNSKVMNALINAARNGKRVNVIIELQAPFMRAMPGFILIYFFSQLIKGWPMK